MTAITGDIAYYSNGYYYTADGTAIPEAALQNTQQTSYIASTKPDTFEISAANETCTDGKDDGKIGFWGALGNMAKGVGKTIVNGVKGMFTDKEGNFSLGKTLLSIGTAALCIAVPAVGVAACAIGAVAGGVQVAKGAIAASQAETDAEAKAAWQNIGGGVFSVATSVAGAKAGVKGMTAGATKATGSSALNTLKSSGTKFTPKTAGQYAKAFLHDGYYSGKYNLGQVKNIGSAILTKNKMNHAEKKLNSLDTGTKKYNKYETMYDNAAEKYYNIDGSARNTALSIEKGLENTSKLPGKALYKVTHLRSSIGELAGAIKKIDFSKVNPKNIPSHLQSAYKFLTTKEATPEAINNLGYDTVAELLALIGGTELVDQSV